MRLIGAANWLPNAFPPSHYVSSVLACADGEITRATEHWNAVLDRYPSDIVAMKLAHEAYFLVGDSHGMLESMSRSMRDWRPGL